MFEFCDIVITAQTVNANHHVACQTQPRITSLILNPANGNIGMTIAKKKMLIFQIMYARSIFDFMQSPCTPYSVPCITKLPKTVE
jgi:hypothetical protein